MKVDTNEPVCGDSPAIDRNCLAPGTINSRAEQIPESADQRD